MFPSVGVKFYGRPSLLLPFFVASAEGMVTGEMGITHGFIVSLNVDDARRWIGAGAKLTIWPVLQ